MMNIVSLAIGGLAGTLARYSLSGLTHKVLGDKFPYGTLVVNLIGCFIVGILVDLAEDKWLLGMNVRLLLIVGFCGAFTTFSSFVLDTSRLIHQGKTGLALANVLLAVILGFFVFRLGVLAAERF